MKTIINYQLSIINDSRGQSIIELLVAITVLSMVLVSVTLMTTKSIQMSESATNREKAISLARSEVEEIRRLKDTCDWDDFRNTLSSCWDGYSNGIKNLSDDYNAIVFLENSSDEFADFSFTISWSDVKGSHNIGQELIFNNY